MVRTPHHQHGCTPAHQMARRRFFQLATAAAAAVVAAPAIAHAERVSTGWQPHPAGSFAPASKVDLVIRAAHVLTMDGRGTVFKPGAVAVRGTEIVAVGLAEEIAARYAAARVIDAPTSVLLPGLIDGHTHLPMTLFRGLADDVPLNVWLEQHIWPAEGRFLSPETIRPATALAAAELIASGVTTVADMYFFEDDIASVLHQVGMRAIVSQAILDFRTAQGLDVEGSFAYLDELVERWQGDDLIIPSIGPHAPYTVSPELFQRAFAYAADRGLPVITHLAETKNELATIQERYGTTPVRHLDSIGVLGGWLIAAHCVWVDDEEIDLLAERQVGVVHNPRSNLKLGSGVAPVPRMIQAGVRLGLGTDGAASNNRLDLLADLQMAALLHKGVNEDPTLVSAQEVLHLATLGGARALGLDHLIGSIEPGKRADLIVVDLNRAHLTPMYDAASHLAYAARGSDVQHVVVNGRVLMEHGELVTVDAEASRDEVREIAAGIAAARSGSALATK